MTTSQVMPFLQLWNETREIILKTQLKTQEKAKEGRKLISYAIGSLVRLSFPRHGNKGGTQKWNPYYYGCYKIIKQLHSDIYLVQCETSGRQFSTSIKRMRAIVDDQTTAEDFLNIIVPKSIFVDEIQQWTQVRNVNNRNKLFIGGLASTTTNAEQKCYFSQFGLLVDHVVISGHRTGKSKSFGFVEYSDSERAEFVLKNCSHKLDGRSLDVKYSDISARPKPIVGSNTARVFFGGLPQNVTESELRDFCQHYGTTTDVVIAVKDEKRLTGVGFASFLVKSSAEALVSQHFITIKGKPVEVKHAEPRPSDSDLLEPFVYSRSLSDAVAIHDLLSFDSEECEESQNASVVTVNVKV